jgi:CRISPR-associated endoribonuclease Cas6
MRLHLTLRPERRGCSISLNYNYYLSSAIYKWIEASSPEYATFLHEKGFAVDGTLHRFKHFCFSHLLVPGRRIENGRLHILSPTVEWYIGMPVEQSLQHLVTGMFERREFFIEREENRFVVEQVETLPEPRWERRMKFRLLSPLTVSVTVEKNGKLLPYYLRSDDPRLTEALRTNLLNKYASLHCRSTSLDDLQDHLHGDTEFRCTLDEKYIAERGGPEKVSKLVTIKEGRRDETRVRGFLCPLTLEGHPALIALAYESGLGEKNSLGFGMIKVEG